LAKKYPSIRIEYPELVNGLKENPTRGVPIGNNC